MNKCCDNCNLVKKCVYKRPIKGVVYNDWDTSKDFCSRWEEKEDTKEKVKNDIMNACLCTDDRSYAYAELGAVTEYFQQRVKESLERAVDIYDYGFGCGKDSVEEAHEQAFDWLLKD